MATGTRTALFHRYVTGGVRTVEDVRDIPHNVWFVDANHASASDASGYGRTPDKPLATTAAAVALCEADKGDLVVWQPGHVEAIGATPLDLDVDGVRYRSAGQGGLAARFDYDNAAASINLAASRCRIEGIRMRPSVTDVLVGVDVEAGEVDNVIEDVEVLPGEDGAGADDFALAIDIKAGCSRTVVRRMKQRQHASAAGYLACIRLTGASDDVVLEDLDLDIRGAGALACVNGITTLSTQVRIRRALLSTDAEPGIEMLTGTTGLFSEVLVFGNLGTIAAAIVADACALHRCEYIEVAPESGVVIGDPSADD